MTTDERLEAVARHLDTLTRIHLDDDREYRERFQQLTEVQERNARDIQRVTGVVDALAGRVDGLAVHLEALRERVDGITELLDSAGDRVGERLDSIGERLDRLTVLSQQDGEHIRTLIRIAELHHQRLERLEEQ